MTTRGSCKSSMVRHSPTGRVIRNTGALRMARSSANDLLSVIKNDDWNEYHLIARGNVLTHVLNGRVMSVVIDDDVKNRTMNGMLGVQVHVGPPMKIEYRNFRLKKLAQGG